MGSTAEQPKVDQIISKSLDEIDTLLTDMGINQELEKSDKQDDLSKGTNPEEVSDDIPGRDDPAENPDEDVPPGDPEESYAGDQDNEPDEDQDEDQEEDEPVDKSLVEELNDNEGVRKALEVSEFLSELVNGLSDILQNQRQDLGKSLESSTQTSDLLLKSFDVIVRSQRGILETQGELAKSLRKLNSRMGKLESQPVGRKSTLSVVEKSFNDSTGNSSVSKSQKPSLNKSQVLIALNDALVKGTPGISASDIVTYETTGNLGLLSEEARNCINLSK